MNKRSHKMITQDQSGRYEKSLVCIFDTDTNDNDNGASVCKYIYMGVCDGCERMNVGVIRK